ncbi:hypothetical protein J6590_090337 [Homalodisca vitripennis]|nr:hypothetical protein J6590_090337 [Homalodisca vitripennis]
MNKKFQEIGNALAWCRNFVDKINSYTDIDRERTTIGRYKLTNKILTKSCHLTFFPACKIYGNRALIIITFSFLVFIPIAGRLNSYNSYEKPLL